MYPVTQYQGISERFAFAIEQLILLLVAQVEGAWLPRFIKRRMIARITTTLSDVSTGFAEVARNIHHASAPNSNSVGEAPPISTPQLPTASSRRSISCSRAMPARPAPKAKTFARPCRPAPTREAPPSDGTRSRTAKQHVRAAPRRTSAPASPWLRPHADHAPLRWPKTACHTPFSRSTYLLRYGNKILAGTPPPPRRVA